MIFCCGNCGELNGSTDEICRGCGCELRLETGVFGVIDPMPDDERALIEEWFNKPLPSKLPEKMIIISTRGRGPMPQSFEWPAITIYPIEFPWSNDGERDYWRAWERVRGDYLRSLPHYVSHHVQEIDS